MSFFNFESESPISLIGFLESTASSKSTTKIQVDETSKESNNVDSDVKNIPRLFKSLS